MRLADRLLQLAPESFSVVAWVERTPEGALAKEWTWLETKRQTAAAAAFLLDHRIAPGDRVVNLGRNAFGWAILDLACSTINAIHVPMDPRMSHSQLANCMERIEPAMVFSDSPTMQQLDLKQLHLLPSPSASLEQLATRYQPDDVANILFTSGTTGAPRGVMLSHRNLVSNAIAKLDAMPQSSLDHRLNFLPFSHAYARTCELSAWLMSYSSMEVVVGIDRVLERAGEIAPTLLNGVPLFYEKLFLQWEQAGGTKGAMTSILGRRIRRLASGGAALPNALRKRMADIGLPVYQGYGLTESSPVICSNRVQCPSKNGEPNLIEVGPPVQGVQVRIDESSKLWVSGDGVMRGYWRDEAATQRKVVDGWLDTGDLAEFVGSSNGSEEQIAIRILGRCDDTIVLSNGYKIEPMPIEQVVAAQPWVEGCLLVGRGRPFSILLLQTNESFACSTGEELLARINDLLVHFPNHTKPRRILLVDEAWTSENGLTNFKGAPIRKKIEARYQEQIQQLYDS